MANFNYLDFIKTPTSTDRVLSIKDKNNVVVYTLNPFKVDNVLVQNNNIRVNFTNSDYVLIDFNNNAESRIAIRTLETNLEVLRNKVPNTIDKQTQLYVDQIVASISTINNNLTVWGDILPATNSVYNLGSPEFQWHSLHVASSSVYIGGVTISTDGSSIVVNSLSIGGSINLQSDGELLYINNSPSFAPSFTNFEASNQGAKILSSTSFRFNQNAFNLTSVRSTEGFDNTQGFRLNGLLPIVNINDCIVFSVSGLENEYKIILYNDLGIPNYSLNFNYNEPLYYGTYSEPLNFSLYSDGELVYYYINDTNILTATYSNDTYYFYSYVSTFMLGDSYTFSNVTFYPAGKRGWSDKYYCTSDSFITIPPINGAVVLETQKNLAWSNGQWARIANQKDTFYTIGDYFADDEASKKFFAQIDSYNKETGELVVVNLKSDNIGATASAWYINLTGEPGDVGSSDVYFNAVSGRIIATTYSVLLQNTTQFQQTTEVINTSSEESADVPTITYGFTQGSIWYHDNLTSDYIANFINVPETTQRTITSTIIISQKSSAAYLPISVKINNNYCPISWSGGIAPIAATYGYDIVGFSFLKWYGTFSVLGQISNYGSLLPQVATVKAINYGYIYGNLINFGADTSVISAGFVMSFSNPEPTIDNNDSITTNISSIGVFSGSFGSSYYIRAYAQNSFGVAYGEVLQYTGPCFAKGTLVTLSDGSTKKIEDITFDDNLLVWNFDEAKFDSSKPIWIMEPVLSDSFRTIFSDGSELITAGTIGKRKTSHRIFNLDKGEFTYLISDEDTPIGTRTFNNKGEIVTIISKENNEIVEIYNVVTYEHLNMFCNSILTSIRLNNMYPIENMKFTKDSREIIPYSKFEGLTEDYYVGFRLGEQPLVEVSDNFVETNTTPTLEELIYHMKTYYK